MKSEIWFLFGVLLCVVAEESPPLENVETTTPITDHRFFNLRSLYKTTKDSNEVDVETTSPITDRTARFFNFRSLYKTTKDSNEVAPEVHDDPNDALKGVYAECVFNFSLPCLQKKFLVFLDKLGRMEGFSIIGDYLSVRRTNKDTTKPITEKVIEARMHAQGDLDSLVDYAIDRFFNNHKIQLNLPLGLTASTEHGDVGRSSGEDGRVIDIAFPRTFTGRGKKKKIALLLTLLAKAKFAFLIPLAFIFIKLKAIKALFFAKAALALSIYALVKKLGIGGLAAAGAAGTAGIAGLGAAGLGLSGIRGGQTQVVQPPPAPVHMAPGQKVVIIHDPHHAVSSGHGHHDSYGPTGGSGAWSSGGGGDSYSSGIGGGGGHHHDGGWARSWTPTVGHGHLAYSKYNTTDKT